MRPVTDRAEIAIDFPEKAYMGSFGPSASFDARAQPGGAELKLAHAGAPKRSVGIHLHWYLFADILDEIAASLEGRAGIINETHRTALIAAAERLACALAPDPTCTAAPESATDHG